MIFPFDANFGADKVIWLSPDYQDTQASDHVVLAMEFHVALDKKGEKVQVGSQSVYRTQVNSGVPYASSFVNCR